MRMRTEERGRAEAFLRTLVEAGERLDLIGAADSLIVVLSVNRARHETTRQVQGRMPWTQQAQLSSQLKRDPKTWVTKSVIWSNL